MCRDALAASPGIRDELWWNVRPKRLCWTKRAAQLLDTAGFCEEHDKLEAVACAYKLHKTTMITSQLPENEHFQVLLDALLWLTTSFLSIPARMPAGTQQQWIQGYSRAQRKFFDKAQAHILHCVSRG